MDLYIPNEIQTFVKNLPLKEYSVGRSGDQVFSFGDKYILKISSSKEELKLEKEKTDWINQYLPGSKSILYIEEKEKAYYLRTFIVGHTLIEEQYVNNPNRLIAILKGVIELLKSLDSKECPFASLDNQGVEFVHGDLCLPNILVDDNDEFVGFVDVANAGKGDRAYDYSWLLWSFEYNLKTDKYNERLLKELNISLNQMKFDKYIDVD